MRQDASEEEGLTVGELAQASGLTVRALHHYDRLGLLVPSYRTSGGHRRYSNSDVAALYRVVALRRLGLSLGDIGALVAEQQPLAGTLRRQLEDTARAVDDQQALLSKLKRSLAAVEASTEPSTDELLGLIADTVDSAAPREDASAMYRVADASAAGLLASFFEGVTSSHTEVRNLISLLTPSELRLGLPPGDGSPASSVAGTRFAASGSVGGLLVHVVVFEDDYVSRAIQSRSAMWERAAWSEQVGVDDLARFRSCSSAAVAEPLPQAFDVAAFGRYAEHVFTATFEYVTALTERELTRDIPGPGRTALTWSMTVSELLAQVLGHSFSHAGQIAALAATLQRFSPAVERA